MWWCWSDQLMMQLAQRPLDPPAVTDGGDAELLTQLQVSEALEKSRPVGEGTFAFSSGLSQAGSYDQKKLAEGEEEEAPEEGAEVIPNVSWNGANIVAF